MKATQTKRIAPTLISIILYTSQNLALCPTQFKRRNGDPVSKKGIRLFVFAKSKIVAN
jgi:hypothetical protein